ncbi:MAG: hypothetical protein LBT70_03385 [Holosporaceae bacterium]|nr:hypothetical protein [Holosporaceae bacterium]
MSPISPNHWLSSTNHMFPEFDKDTPMLSPDLNKDSESFKKELFFNEEFVDSLCDSDNDLLQSDDTSSDSKKEKEEESK